jgi:hypothetical protein
LKSIGGTVTAFGVGESSPREKAQEISERMTVTTTAALTKVRYRSELPRPREREITRFQIADFRFQIYRRRRDAPDEIQSKIGNRNSTMAAQPP